MRLVSPSRVQIVSALQAAGKAITPPYIDDLRVALLTYRHQTVFAIDAQVRRREQQLPRHPAAPAHRYLYLSVTLIC